MRKFLDVFRSTESPATAAIRCTAQPEVVKYTDNGVRKLLLAHDRTGFLPIGVEWEIPDARTFLNEVWACTQWVADSSTVRNQADNPSHDGSPEG